MRVNQNMIRQVQQRILQAQEELAKQTVEVTVGGGAVRVIMNGQQEIVEIHIEPDVVDPEDVEMLQDLIIAAVNEAVERSRDLAQDSMGSLLGGMGLPPGLF
ncbi:MAG: YbaB/EbfC family nucleoid-associated protein [Chloroflexia bacterium]|nr:YbaB/EbfC family nucleoid-associated protein [Chloroflexia bacterium]